MARKIRLEYAGASYHVINRGNYRQNVFGGQGAAEAFERCLAETSVRFGWRVHAYVIMRNHFHLAVETPEPNLSEGMKFLQGTWANRFNRYRGLVGRPFQGRYKALHVEPGKTLAQVANYIHLNPARAKIVPAEKSGEFRWSSLWHYLSAEKRPDWLCAGTVLLEAGGLPDTPSGWSLYLGYLATLAEAEPSKRKEKYGALSRGWAMGSDAFKEMLREEMRKRGAELENAVLSGETGGGGQQVRESAWEARLQALAAVAKVDLTKLGPRKSDPAKVLLAAAMRATGSVSNGWLCERLAMGTAASVSQFVRKWSEVDANKELLKNALGGFVKN